MRPYYVLAAFALLTACVQPNYPMGMNQQQWQMMTPAQQQQAWADQQRQQALIAQQQEAAMRQQQAQQLENEKIRLEQGARVRLGITDQEWLHMPEQQRFALRQEQEQIERSMRIPVAPQPMPMPGAPVYGAPPVPAYVVPVRDNNRLYTNPTYGALVDCEITGGKGKFDQGWRPLGTTHFSIAKGDAQNVEIRRSDKQRFTDNFWVGFSPNEELEFCADADTDQRYKRCRKITVTPAFQQGVTSPFSIPSKIDGASITCRFAQGRR